MSDPVTGRTSGSEDDEIDLLQLFRTIWGGKKSVFLIAVLAGILGCVVILNTPPTFKADALLQLEENNASLSLPAGLSEFSESSPQSVTEIEIVKSRLVLGQAVSDLNLDWVAVPKYAPVIGYAFTKLPFELPEWPAIQQYATGEELIRLDLLQVPPEWVSETIDVTKGEGEAYTVVLPDGRRLDGSIGLVLADESLGFALKIGELVGRQGRVFNLVQRRQSDTIASVRSQLSVSEKGRNSGILQLSYTAGSREQARQVLHSITQAYVGQNVRRSAAEALKSLEFVEGQLPLAKQKVEAAEDLLNAFRQSQDAIDLGFETQTLLTQISRLENELRQLDVEEVQLKDRYTPNHPVYKQLLVNKEMLASRIEALREETTALPETERDIIALTRSLEVEQDAYLQMLTRAQELQVLQASSIGHIRIVDQAHAQFLPVAPRKSRILGLSLVLGIIIGVAFVLIRNALHPGVRSSTQIEELGIPVFATINKSAADLKSGKKKGSRKILAVSNPTDLAIESFRSLRTSLQFGMLDADSKSVAVTGPSPEVGKSFVSANFAVVSAQSGQRVCLVDADMRRGHLRNYFSRPKNEAGLAEVLTGEKSIEDVTISTDVEGLDFISTGRYPPNPADLLARPVFQDTLKKLDEKYDLIVLDCPPVLAVTDAAIIAQFTGISLFVARFDVTPIGEITATKRIFENDGLTFAGAIFNGFDPKKASARGDHHYQNYRYDYQTRS